MKWLQNFWRSLVCFLISTLLISLISFGVVKATPLLFQDGVWAKIGVLAVGIEIGGFILYLAMSLITGCILSIAQYRKTPRVLGTIPIICAIVRYPWWLISVCCSVPVSFGFWQWVIVIVWIATWVITLAISIGALFTDPS